VQAIGQGFEAGMLIDSVLTRSLLIPSLVALIV
jgi:hypothetical protein